MDVQFARCWFPAPHYLVVLPIHLITRSSVAYAVTPFPLVLPLLKPCSDICGDCYSTALGTRIRDLLLPALPLLPPAHSAALFRFNICYAPALRVEPSTCWFLRLDAYTAFHFCTRYWRHGIYHNLTFAALCCWATVYRLAYRSTRTDWITGGCRTFHNTCLIALFPFTTSCRLPGTNLPPARIPAAC